MSIPFGVNNIHAVGAIGLKNAGLSDYMSRKAKAEAKKEPTDLRKNPKRKK